ncbi:MAG: DUF2064 domain-containing protein, partial [Gammaproteobacteria bacterium]|nr:DUF2064 domain-containing protein [Gemmatimonadota bacterium]NIU73860.1 DUF2064 domain-containing protein [Gammaproteobacteria bacterium]NIY08164.1 DUF2064 domain-containing protein [Gemmatimonadota bacterium]
LVVSFAPRDGESRRLVRAWLGPEGIELRAQSGGDLGMRMAAFFDEALDEAGEAILVGSDIPGIDRRTVTTAFERLVRHDVVLGPASDGGYWLVGLSRRCPELFRGIAWSTDRVLAETVARA